MKTLILEASGHMRFSWEREHAISHFLQPLHFAKSLAIHMGSFFVGKLSHPSSVVNLFKAIFSFKCVTDYDNTFK
jgi:hypothetical protein